MWQPSTGRRTASGPWFGTKNAKRRVTPRKSFLSQIGFRVNSNLRLRTSYTCWQFSTRVGRSGVSNICSALMVPFTSAPIPSEGPLAWHAQFKVQSIRMPVLLYCAEIHRYCTARSNWLGQPSLSTWCLVNVASPLTPSRLMRGVMILSLQYCTNVRVPAIVGLLERVEEGLQRPDDGLAHLVLPLLLGA